MGRKAALFASIVLALAGWGSSAAAAETCKVDKLAELPAQMSGLRARVAAKINGVDVTFTVDSGAFFSVINPATVERFKLATSMAPRGMYVRGLGGSEDRVYVTTVRHFGLAGHDYPQVEFLVLPPVDPGSAGVLGQNIFAANDVEYDFGNGMIRLMRPSPGCAHADLAYWAGAQQVGVVDIGQVEPTHASLRGEAKINGKTIRVVFDTGSPLSLLKLSSAERLGFRPDAPGVVAAGVSGGIGRHVAESWVAPFDSFELGGEQVLHTKLRVADVLIDADMLLGADFFLSHRIYVSYQQHRIFFTYNGGPVFQLGRPPPPPAGVQVAAATPGAPQGAAPAPTNPYSDTPTDAAGYIRRGQAFMSRRDFAAAAADFDKAIQLDPKTPANYVERARAHLALRQPVFAMNDFNAALKLNPAAPGALIGRGQLYLISRDLPHAQADFDAALKADPNLLIAVAQIYANAARFEPAVADFDAWIAAHPRDDHLAVALAARCRTRVLWNHEIDKALADCDAALRRGPRTAELFETRGLVHLRRGALDAALADFDEALKLQPKLAWARYARGLAEVQKGQAAAGQADMAAAVALAPNIGQTALRYGFGAAAAQASAQ